MKSVIHLPGRRPFSVYFQVNINFFESYHSFILTFSYKTMFQSPTMREVSACFVVGFFCPFFLFFPLKRFLIRKFLLMETSTPE